MSCTENTYSMDRHNSALWTTRLHSIFHRFAVNITYKWLLGSTQDGGKRRITAVLHPCNIDSTRITWPRSVSYFPRMSVSSANEYGACFINEIVGNSQTFSARKRKYSSLTSAYDQVF